MKELSIKEKAKRYDEAVEIAKEINNEQQAQPFNIMTRVFPELKESEDERIRNGIIEFIKINLPYASSWLAWLEKQGEQKPVDKVEPKFHEGDWIIFNGLILYIKEVVKGYYRTISIDGIPNSYDWDIDNVARLWTIQDAKDGDVLYHKAENGIEYIVMSKGLNEFNNIDSYFRYNSIDGFGIDVPSVLSAKCDSITPATKEQHDTLMKAMADAGYTFDFEKKELKKIGNKNPMLSDFFNAECEREKADAQKPAWSEEDEEFMKWSINNLTELKDRFGEEYGKVGDCINWLKSLKDRVRLKQEWSECNRILQDTSISYLCNLRDEFEAKGWDKEQIQKCINWLQSLSPQSHWKPSNEQMGVIEAVINNRSFQRRHLDSLYNDLKKLRGEE